LEFRERFLDDFGGDGIVPAKEGIEITGQLEHLLLAERTALANDFIPLGIEELVVFSRGVLK
jgi:hypothetical protein